MKNVLGARVRYISEFKHVETILNCIYIHVRPLLSFTSVRVLPSIWHFQTKMMMRVIFQCDDYPDVDPHSSDVQELSLITDSYNWLEWPMYHFFPAGAAPATS